ncbi:MAG: methyltransferase domain-containing protein [Elusimicrobia bacterium]|nr:methyltransferase domain-containing protein [Elusimicrobiota bacterium]
MIAELKDSQLLHKPELHSFQRKSIHFFVDPQRPNWAATDARGAKILQWIDGGRGLGEITRLYAQFYELELGRAWRDVGAFAREGLRRGLISRDPSAAKFYRGRDAHLEPRLRELWVHLLQTCNLSCTHCLVSSDPSGERGPETGFYLKMIEQACQLGVSRFYFTGGEPMVRPDFFKLCEAVTREKKAELIVLTNATLLEGSRLEALKAQDPSRLKFQVSLDGASAELNDRIRGAGVFEKACAGLKSLRALGFETVVTAVVTRDNIRDLEGLPALAHELGARSVHLMWLHRRGRILDSVSEPFPSVPELLQLCRKVRAESRRLGIVFDNWESLALRVDGRPGVKYDLGNQCWESLCLHMDGHIYPSAATAGEPALDLGDARQLSLGSIWLDSPTARAFRRSSLVDKPEAHRHPLRFLTGGGDIEHSYFFGGLPEAEDPYHELYAELCRDIMAELACRGRESVNRSSGFNPPMIYHAMGEGSISCPSDAQLWLEKGQEPAVRLLHSNCVLSFDVEKPYRVIQEFYGKAALEPQQALCCPVKYDETETGHIPREVIERFYGCGSPIAQAEIKAGETVLDLGSGAGIDCFIAAKKVGRSGRVIGVDMTDRMLEVARRCQAEVAVNLGYDAVEFREGFLERIPAEDKSVDIVTSNCVINLSPDKRRVFAEIWRVLKDHGRMVVADIVSDRPVPMALQAHKDLWGECLSGALSEEEFSGELERAGFYGLCTLKKTFWKEIEGVRFFSVTVRGFKFEKKMGCSFIGQRAVYLGPYKAAVDEEGHLFPRGECVEVCTDTAAKLSRPPYAGQFKLLGGAESREPSAEIESCCAPGSCC